MRNIKYKFVRWIIQTLIKTPHEKRSLRTWLNYTFLEKRFRIIGGYETEYLMKSGLNELEVPDDKGEEVIDNEAGAFYDEMIEVSDPRPEKASDVLEYIGIHHLYDL